MPSPVYKTINPTVIVEGVEDQPYELWCNSITLALAPSFSDAKLSYRYGRIGDSTLQKQEPLDLRGKIIKISDPNGPKDSFIFRGVVEPQTDSPHQTVKDAEGNDVATGNTAYTAYSFDFLLDRVYIDKTYFSDGASSFTINRVYPFNGGTSGVIEPNRSLQTYEDGYMFDQRNSSDDEITAAWTVYDMIANYLLPRFSAITGYTWKFNPPNQEHIDALKQIVIRYNPANKSLRQCLNELLAPERGFSWHTTFDEDGNPQISPVSITDQAIAPFNTEVIPANPNTVNFGSVIKYSGEIASATIGRPQNMLYSEIRLVSEPIRVTATLKLGQNLQPVWTTGADGEDTAYGEATDAERVSEKYQRVYQHFSLLYDWDKTDYQRQGVVASVDESDGSVSLSGNENAVPEYWTFERTLPYKVNEKKSKSQYKKPFLLLPDPSDPEKYVISDKTLKSPKVGFRMLDNAPGVELSPTINHIMGKTHFSGTNSEYEATYDYSQALATVSYYTDAVLAIRVSGVAITPARTKQIYIPGYHFWVTKEGTYLDNDTKAAGSVSGGDDITRSDRGSFKQLAAAAKAWYGRERNIGTVNYNGYADIYNYLGYIATEFYSGGSFVPGGTVISKISYMFDTGTQSTILSTDMNDINFAKIGSRENTLSQSAMRHSINRLQSAVENIPLRPIGGDNSGSAYNGYFKLIKISDTQVNIVDGNDYDNTKCGWALINQTKTEALTPLSPFTIAADAFIYFEVEATWNGTVWEVGTPEFKQSATMFEYEANKYKELIGTVKFADGKIVGTPVQQHYGMIQGETAGDC